MKKLIPLIVFFICALSAQAQTVTVGATNTVLTEPQRNAVDTFWPDGNQGAIFHSGTNHVFSADGGATLHTTISDLNDWTTGFAKVTTTTQVPKGAAGSFDQNYAGVAAVYFDATSGILIGLYHAEFWYNPPSGAPFYGGHGLAYSTDFGANWHKLGQIVSPQTLRTGSCQSEIGQGTLLVVGSFFYDYYTDQATGCNGSLYLAVARASISSVIAAAQAGTPFTSGPGTLFMKYTGSGTWNGNGVTDLANPQNGGGASTAISPVFILEPQVRFDNFINQYVMAYSNGFQAIEVQLSPDGITWGTRTTVATTTGAQLYYATLLNTTGGGTDPQLLGQNFFVYYNNTVSTAWSTTSLSRTAITLTPSGTAPNIANLSVGSGPVGTAVTITGTNFGATQGTSTVTFNGTTATVGTWSATSITTTVPAGATTGNVVVTVGGVPSNGVNFTVTVPAPTISNLSVTSGNVGTPVTITGTNFGSTQGASTVTFNGTVATVGTWSATSLSTTVPAGATTGNVVVTVSGQSSNGINFTVTGGSSSPTIQGTCDTGSFTVTSKSCTMSGNVLTTSDVIAVFVYASTNSFTGLTVTGCGATWTLDPVLGTISHITMATGINPTVGSCVVTANNLGGGTADMGVSGVIVTGTSGIDQRGTTIIIGSVSAGTPVNAPSLTTTKSNDLVLGLFKELNGVAGTWTAGSGWTQDTTGSTLSSSVEHKVNGSASAIQPTATFSVTGNMAAASLALFPLNSNPPPAITNLSQTVGAVGSPITITGTNFGSTQGTSTVTFGGVTAAVTTWSATSLSTTVPSGAITGNVVVTVGGVQSNGVFFTVTGSGGCTQPWCGIVAQSRGVDWSQAGLPGSVLPDASWPICQTLTPAQAGGDGTAIHTAFLNCNAAHPTGGIVALSAGTFTLSTGICFPNNNTGHLALQGAGANLTQINFTGTPCALFGNGFIAEVGTDSAFAGSGGTPNVLGVNSGFQKGSQQLILSSLTGAGGGVAVVGSVLILNQCDTGYTGSGLGVACTIPTPPPADNGGLFHCQYQWTATNLGCAVPGEGGNGTWRGNATEIEIAVITAINQGGCGATCVTLAQPIQQPDWAAGVQAVLIQPLPMNGIENLSIDGGSLGNGQYVGIYMNKTLHSWISGVTISNMSRDAIRLEINFGDLVKDSYIFGGAGNHDTAAMSLLGGGNHLIQNNICHGLNLCDFNGDAESEQGDVFAYNFSTSNTNGLNTNATGTMSTHTAGSTYTLLEGNNSFGSSQDGDHGPSDMFSMFRNFFWGWGSCANGQCAQLWNSGVTYCITNQAQSVVWYAPNSTYYTCSANSNSLNQLPTNGAPWSVTPQHAASGNGQVPILTDYGVRYENIIGNVLGTPGFNTIAYNSTNAFASGVIYITGAGRTIGSVAQPNDPLMLSTSMLWGNWDTFNNATRFVNAEVPTAAPTYPNPVPANQSLPASFYLTSKPSWFGSIPWPATGPDISGGNVGQCSGTFDVAGQQNGLAVTNGAQCTGSSKAAAWASHVNANPAMNCYLNVMGGLPDGTGPILTFNPSACYSGAVTAPGISFNPGTINFTNQPAGQQSLPVTVTMTNTGNANLIITAFALQNGGSSKFVLGTNTCGSPVPPNLTCTVQVSFLPTANGLVTDNLQITDNAGAGVQLIPLSGFGGATFAIPETLSFKISDLIQKLIWKAGL